MGFLCAAAVAVGLHAAGGAGTHTDADTDQEAPRDLDGPADRDALDLDAAGHLQKEAPVDGLLISGETAGELSSREGLVRAGSISRDQIEAYRVVI